jgi:hypothetical protein
MTYMSSQDKAVTINPIPATSPFDPSRFRLSQNFHESLGVKKALITVPVRKPARQDFIRVRVHPDASYRLETAVLNLKEEREIYLVEPALWSELASEITPMALLTVVNRQKVASLWPIRLPGPDGRTDEWNTSAAQAAQLAQTCWVRIISNMNLGAYEVFEATGELPEPEWPEIGFEELLRIAFRGRFIDTLEHPVVQRLGGQA